MAISKTTGKTPAKKTAAPAKASKAPAAKTTKPAAAAKPAAKPAAATKKADPPKASKAGKRALPPDQRRNYVEVAAYFIAERHGFTPGREIQDWAAAEAEIDRLLAEGLINP